MPRLTTTLTDDLYNALKDAAVRADKPVRQIVEESLDLYGIKAKPSTAEFIARIRKNAQVPE